MNAAYVVTIQKKNVLTQNANVVIIFILDQDQKQKKIKTNSIYNYQKILDIIFY